MLGKSLALLVLATVAFAEIPSYIKVCGRRNPNLDKCVLESVEGLRDKLREGIPEVDAPPLEPLFVDGFPVSETEQLRATARNITLYGLSNFDINSFHVDRENMTIYIDITIKKVTLDADYNVVARIIVPIAGKGPINIVSDDIHSTAVLKYKLVKKNGQEYMFFPSMKLKLDIRDYKANFKPAEGPESTLATAINAALEGGRQEILESIRPTLERVIAEEVLKIANKITQHFTYNELFPDKE